MTFKAWAVNALKTLPGEQGTLEDIGAVFLADPAIAPKLDHRPTKDSQAVPRWRSSLASALKPYNGFINTGAKKGKLTVLGYDPHGTAAFKCRRAARKGQPGLLYLGRRSRNAN
ncbi:hypothetical protein HYH03_014912 [Edaphochlamys debaryana]|uniref:Uncharacterized protein n=1 Tax=Edaphochlamys debaryana TaxID=47281 RepID=A0A835XN15_9CHLO|nr:hypothetical protein HYH03_014912 [Edaphochlamys debaryana]|eukprot:KAG2486465.1 hypothetical protein HYH03_014912 [Edaphochlamys debaryana]